MGRLEEANTSDAVVLNTLRVNFLAATVDLDVKGDKNTKVPSNYNSAEP